MYRLGIPAQKIAAGAGVAESVVRYHLAIAAKQDSGLREAHKQALPRPAQRITDAGRRNLADILAFHQAEQRLPVNGRSPRESALAGWLSRRREEAAAGNLSPVYAEALDSIPGWRDQPTKREADAVRWQQRLAEVAAYLAAGHEFPRHNKTQDQEERTLGVWLHTQRIDHRAGKLTPAKEEQLNSLIPGWQQGRPRRGANSNKG